MPRWLPDVLVQGSEEWNRPLKIALRIPLKSVIPLASSASSCAFNAPSSQPMEEWEFLLEETVLVSSSPPCFLQLAPTHIQLFLVLQILFFLELARSKVEQAREIVHDSLACRVWGPPLLFPWVPPQVPPYKIFNSCLGNLRRIIRHLNKSESDGRGHGEPKVTCGSEPNHPTAVSRASFDWAFVYYRS